jgi:membrane associated rhomboid family serine protease
MLCDIVAAVQDGFWETLGTAFLWSGIAAAAAALIALVVGMVVVARREELAPADDEKPPPPITPPDVAGGEEGLDRSRLELLAAGLRLRSERRRRTARLVRRLVLVLLALWILGPLAYALYLYLR